jgi:uncharacterized protein YodC (DUF2158 family)
MSRSNLKLVDKAAAEEAMGMTEPEFKDGDGGGGDNNPYDIGDLVELLSGGPAMTVVGYDDESERVIVAWFKDEEMNSVELPADAITDYEEDGE